MSIGSPTVPPAGLASIPLPSRAIKPQPCYLFFLSFGCAFILGLDDRSLLLGCTAASSRHPHPCNHHLRLLDFIYTRAQNTRQSNMKVATITLGMLAMSDAASLVQPKPLLLKSAVAPAALMPIRWPTS